MLVKKTKSLNNKKYKILNSKILVVKLKKIKGK